MTMYKGIFLRRYKRFFADVLLGDETVVAHVPNTGSLKSCSVPQSPCLVSKHDDPKRKLRYTLEMIRAPDSWVGVNTQKPNALVAQALRSGLLPHWRGFESVRPEYKINAQTRIDFVLERSNHRHFVEVKNVTMAEGGRALFPDATTERGQKHIRELAQLIAPHVTAEIVFVIQRSDCLSFATADAIDPVYGALLRDHHAKGLRVTPLVCDIGPQGVSLTDRVLPFIVDPSNAT